MCKNIVYQYNVCMVYIEIHPLGNVYGKEVSNRYQRGTTRCKHVFSVTVICPKVVAWDRLQKLLVESNLFQTRPSFQIHVTK